MPREALCGVGIREFLSFPSLRTRHETVARGSRIIADVSARSLRLFCRFTKKDPSSLLRLSGANLHPILLEFVTRRRSANKPGVRETRARDAFTRPRRSRRRNAPALSSASRGSAGRPLVISRKENRHEVVSGRVRSVEGVPSAGCSASYVPRERTGGRCATDVFRASGQHLLKEPCHNQGRQELNRESARSVLEED